MSPIEPIEECGTIGFHIVASGINFVFELFFFYKICNVVSVRNFGNIYFLFFLFFDASFEEPRRTFSY